jgi:hypothetical protein
MRLVDNYNYLPGCCWICRGVAKPIIDMEQDLDGHNSPDDPNPSAVTRLYICADCAIEIGRMCAPSRGLDFARYGELDSLTKITADLINRAEDAERRLAAIAGAVDGVQFTVTEKAGSVSPTDGDDLSPGDAPSESDAPLVRKRGRPRREEPVIDTDFVGDL